MDGLAIKIINGARRAAFIGQEDKLRIIRVPKDRDGMGFQHAKAAAEPQLDIGRGAKAAKDKKAMVQPQGPQRRGHIRRNVVRDVQAAHFASNRG